MRSDRIIVRVSPELAPCIPEYLEITRAQFAEATAAFATGDLNAVRVLGHNLKGTGASFEIDELTHLGARIEAAAVQGARDRVALMLDELKDYLERLTVLTE